MTNDNAISKWSPSQSEAYVTLSATAVTHFKRYLHSQGDKAGRLIRFGIKPSGCSGYAYAIDIIDKLNDDDHLIKIDDELSFAVSSKALPFVQGTHIDYIKEGLNYRINYVNPNETSSCGCGESFTTEDSSEN